MLSNKLTFSLVFIVMLALVAGPALAQTMNLSVELNGNADNADGELGKDGFVVYVKNGEDDDPNNGVADHATASLDPVASIPAGGNDVGFPDIEELLRFGGTIELLLQQGADLTGTPAEAGEESKLLHRLAITEIMWGLDAYRGDENITGDPQDTQWIEIYNEGPDLKTGDSLRLLFTANQRLVRDKVKLSSSTAGSVTLGTADANPVYTVVDRVSTVDQYGNAWAPKGQSGRTVATTTDPIANLISMHRKRSTAAGQKAYKYKDGKPDGDKFADGTKADQWIASVGRLNMSGNFTGTPGAVHRTVGGQTVFATDPASLPVGSVIINEIYNGNDLQWVELHNTGTAEVNVKKYELEAAHGSKVLQRVFMIPDKDTKIPAGGFLVVASVDPDGNGMPHRLAAGNDLYNSNEFNKGATHLYITIPMTGDNKWMPAENFLLVLRTENKDNHEKIVDIAGNEFIDGDGDPVTAVWPLQAWGVPGDRDDADWGGKDKSLARNAGMTYARKGSRANRLHKEDWEMVGLKGGLGYDPNTDHAISPGTPGYANGALKDKPADIAGEVVISEVMYDSGESGKLVQWIELYNSSMTTSANLSGWELEIRNIDTDVESYVDSHFKFDADAVILPNQPLLLVSDRSSASDVPSNRVYNLYQKHRNDLGLSNRRSILLSSVGFYLELKDKDRNMVDAAGNVMLDGPRRTVMWALPETGGDMRHSILRQFGTRKRANPGDTDYRMHDPADDGTMETSWRASESVGSYYGHRDDVGSPGHREGSPLPVSLSSFRPVRDKATGEVVIRWATESELNNAGFNILRSGKNGQFKVVNLKGIIPGHGTTSEKHVYEWKDTTAKPNVVYYYQIEDVSLDGERTTLATTHLRGNVNAAGKLTTTWGDLKTLR